MDRRHFVAALGTAAGAGLLLPGCGPSGRASGERESVGQGGAGASEDIPEGQPALVLRQPSFELLTGESRRYTFLLVDQDNVAVEADAVDLYLADLDEEVLDGPWQATNQDEGDAAVGVFRTFIDLPDPGQYYLIAVHEGQKGMGVVDVVDAADSEFPATGDPAVPSATPTTADDRGYEQLCTADPDCGMHETSLEDALAEGRPVMLLFATPAYCQTGVCGPSVEVADRVRREGDWGDLAWVHAEIYTDAGDTLAPPVEEWGLPSEPWAYAIDGDGTIAERIDGPMVAEDFTDLARLVT